MSTENESAKRKLKILDYLKELETKGNAANSGIETGKSLLVTGVGLLAGAFVGRPSLVVGLGTTFAGYYWDKPKLTQLGVGLMTTGGFQLYEKGVGDAQLGAIDAGKERVKKISASLKHSLYIDKIFQGREGKKENKSQGTGDLGEAQYFNFSGNELGTGSLESIEDAIRQSGEQYAGQNFRGQTDDFSGIEERLY